MNSSKMIVGILVKNANIFNPQCSGVKSFFKEHSNSLATVFSQDFVVNIIIRLLVTRIRMPLQKWLDLLVGPLA
jgi:hypothetical protein